jgi:hypothetical protein
MLLPVILLLLGAMGLARQFRHAQAQTTIPPAWDVLADDFEGGTLDLWQTSTPGPYLSPGGGHFGSTGLAVPVSADSTYLYQTGIARAEEAYLTFWFHPNSVSIPDEGTSWIPGKSLAIAEVVNSDDWWPPLVALYVHQAAGQGYQAYLAWPENAADDRHFDYDNAFPLVNGWQQITIGYRINAWVAVWLNGSLMRQSTSIVHTDPYGDIAFLGKVRSTSNTPAGTMLFDEVAFQVPRLDDLWVDAASGDDGDDGLTPATALRTIQRAADQAGPGTTVHIQPGVYRETVTPALNGSAAESVRYVAEGGPGTAVIRGSEPSSALAWTQLTANTIGLPPGVDPANVYFADLSAWGLSAPPRFLVELNGAGEIQARLPLAREPDWEVATEWKHHEYWWAADGGSGPAACNPATDSDPNCDLPSRSTTQLTDLSNDPLPAGVEPGNLSTLGDLTGGTVVAIDTLQGHYVYRRTISAHNVGAGRITVNRICEHDSGTNNPGLGWGSKYYVEGLPGLIDTPGEWWYDSGSGRLYLWPPEPGDPAGQDIEISARENGFSLRNRSNITLEGLTIEIVDGSAVFQGNWESHKSYGNTLRDLTLQYANWGVYIEQSVDADAPPGNVIDGFTVEDSEIAYMDSLAFRLIDWWENGADPDLFTRSGVRNTVIRNNELHHLGFRTDGDNAVGSSFTFANMLTFEGNHVHHVAHNGVQFSRSVIQSPQEYDFDPSEIKTGEILVRGNIFEKACQLTTDCGGLKIWGSPPDNHVFREFLVTDNIFRDTYGWTWVSEQRRRWMGGESSDVRGLGGFGLYIDHASGIHAFRNIAYNNAYTGYMVYGRWRDGAIVYVNNVAANSLYGMSLGGGQYDDHGAVDTRVLNNILVNNEAFGITLSYAEGSTANTSVDHNLYFNNGWRSFDDGGIWHAGEMVIREGGSWEPYETLSELQAATPWEFQGVAGDPVFWDYNPADHDLFDGSWPDFHLTAASAQAIDRGTGALPGSLVTLLDNFGVTDYHWGAAYDIGRYEAGFALVAEPAAFAMMPGETVTYTISLFPPDLDHEVDLSLVTVHPDLTLDLSPGILSGASTAVLVATDNAASAGSLFTIELQGTGGGFTSTVDVLLLVGGERLYLPGVNR